jgi:two-component system probable response regulator PhcQ
MYTVLLVDDEPGILAAVRRVLAAIPPEKLDGDRLKIETSQDPREALSRCEDTSYDLIISDYRMPGMSGVELLTAIADLLPQSARLLLSGYADLEGIIGALNEARVFRFIPKPWNDHELRMAVVQALAVRALEVENRQLADLVRRKDRQLSHQETELRRLESEHPGITHLQQDEAGAIFIDEDDL